MVYFLAFHHLDISWNRFSNVFMMKKFLEMIICANIWYIFYEKQNYSSVDASLTLFRTWDDLSQSDSTSLLWRWFESKRAIIILIVFLIKICHNLAQMVISKNFSLFHHLWSFHTGAFSTNCVAMRENNLVHTYLKYLNATVIFNCNSKR